MDFPNTSISEFLMLIVSSPDTEIVERAWINLRQLEFDFEYINLIDTVKIIITKTDIRNVQQIPDVLALLSQKIDENPFEVNSTSDTYNYAQFLRRIITLSGDLSLLCRTIKILIIHKKIYLPDHRSIVDFCIAIVHCLSLCTIPVKASEVSEFQKDCKVVSSYLSKILKFCETAGEINALISNCMLALSNIITETDPNRVPSAALTIVIELVEPDSIPGVIQSVVRSFKDENLSRLVSVLAIWLTQLLRNDTLQTWNLKCIEIMHKEGRVAALNCVLNNCLKRLLSTLKLPMARNHTMPVVRMMLIHISTPQLLYKIKDEIEAVFSVLQRDSSTCVLDYIQDLVNCVTALMRRFSNHSHCQSLERCLPLPPQENVVAVFLKISLWNENSKSAKVNYNDGKRINKHAGLNNLGNTCYMNSILQALLMTSQFCNQILFYNEDLMKKNSVLYELQRLFALLLYSQRPHLSPTDFSRVSKPSYFTSGQQHDSAEFLCHLLDVLHEQERPTMECEQENSNKLPIYVKKTETQESIDISGASENSDNQSSLNENINSTSSLVYQIFGGELNTIYQCNQCTRKSHNNDNFWEMQLSFPEEIPRNKEVTIQDLIDFYLSPEKLTGENMYYCNHCDKLCDAQRIIKISRAPTHLILTLKHFHYNINNRLRTKLFHNVDYGGTIQIPVFNSGDNCSETYQFYAAVVHAGYSMDYGHYFTYARDRSKKWYKFNDSCVLETTLDEFFELKAPYTPYILFYEKVTDDLEGRNDEKPIVTTLSKNIYSIVTTDAAKYQTEQKYYLQNGIRQSIADDCYQLPTSLAQQRDNSDDDNPPPTNCRDSVDIKSNRYLY